MSNTYKDLSLTSYPDGQDPYKIFVDVNADNVSYVEQIQTCLAAHDFDGAKAVFTAHPELNNVIATATMFQLFEDQIIAMERFYKSNVVDVISHIVTYDGNYSPSATYQIFHSVSYSGKVYMCISDTEITNILPTDTNSWILVTLQGPAGTGLTPYTSWDNMVAYNDLAVVPYANKLYISLQENNLNHQPDISPDWWKIILLAPIQTITSTTQPIGQDENGYWHQTNSTDNSYKVQKSNGDGTYTQKFPESNANFIKTSDGSTVQTKLTDMNTSISDIQTDLSTDNRISTYTHSYNSTTKIHNLQGTGSNIKFLATVDYHEGDTWTVNGSVVTALTQDNQVLSDSFFVANNWVNCIYSDGKLNFKGGVGSIKELYDFPMSMQTATPTPVNTNHIWIHNDTKMRFGIDEAIRATDWNGSDMYYGIVDSTDNNYMDLEAPKKLTDGTVVDCWNRHIQRDTAPFVLSNGVAFAKKNGLNYYTFSQSKWPRIYSRIGGVIDMEDAQRWDGSAWQWLSQKGKYLFGHFTDTQKFKVYNRAEAVLDGYREITYSTPTVVDRQGDIEFSKSHVYVATATQNISTSSVYSTKFNIFKRIGDMYSLLYTTTIAGTTSGNPVLKIAWSDDDQYIALLITNSSIDNGLYLITNDGSDNFSISSRVAPARMPGLYNYMIWVNHNLWVDQTLQSVSNFAVSGGTFVEQTAITGLQYYIMHMVKYGDMMVCLASDSPSASSGSWNVALYKINSETSLSLVTYLSGASSTFNDSKNIAMSATQILVPKYAVGFRLLNYTSTSMTTVTDSITGINYNNQVTFTPNGEYFFGIDTNNHLNSFSVNSSGATLLHTFSDQTFTEFDVV